MKLVEDVKKAWTWFSMQAMALAAAFPFVWAELPEEIKVYIPSSYMKYVVAAILIGGMLGRIVKQDKTNAQNAPK